ncbi:cytoplasmic iron level regulating protein YaaA (DUF328/UPF0246 family) [Breznakia sp. PF5-3]|uniref:peroxide stress protein YaaA n=1 Tax=unclassified Breznakia TaxID=2623764 RepID=UPI0024076722|nr:MULTISPECIES: peroxide stress protein YaaA [unclassified Breznakia]MDF9824884.1 cytoplasmic iron level regulating protein YaaA (DUF328/UPF0246 family) [Breznakia sp. PM6-1]MDF9835617.1 cytoplasmic iron level regulating protein YaaA (DUF328/UPF0246 family) [Breznakia sp. PF5-3]MDF9837967.1 cytoplasmic iron level regulating protein YaaA (DUF328/UPF0246 family) [Breznakia sp. PFB2-8]MDF9859956.1 cytoplasmic iron level regulating protein YaaA (DUF328/UPF0246 family) [Breznakia sp. PH5-24]
MIILISPTKTMVENPNDTYCMSEFFEISKSIMKALSGSSIEGLMKLMKIKEPLATQNHERFSNFSFDGKGTSAILAYQGIQYKYMQPASFNKEERQYAQKHLRILSGLYGILKPYDNIYPYRLEMQTKLSINEYKNLYALWKPIISKYIMEEIQKSEEPYILNLASNEYSKVLDEQCKMYMITISFKVIKEGIPKNEATQAKIARGRMVHFLANKDVHTLDEIKQFHEDGYQYDETLSSVNEMVFVKNKR